MGVGKNIKKYRLEKGMTRAELAKLSLIHADYLRTIEEEKTIPHMKAIARIANATGVSIEDLRKDE